VANPPSGRTQHQLVTRQQIRIHSKLWRSTASQTQRQAAFERDQSQFPFLPLFPPKRMRAPKLLPPPSGLHTAPIGDETADLEPAGLITGPQSSSQQAVEVAAVRGATVAFKQSKIQGGCQPCSMPQPPKARRNSLRTARASGFREPRRCAGCGERSWRVGSWKANSGPRAPQPRGHTLDRAPRPSRPAVALLLQGASLGRSGSHARLPAIRERFSIALASPAARQVGLRDRLRQCHSRRQRSASSSMHCPSPWVAAHNGTSPAY
jgi:hypothetical protein